MTVRAIPAVLVLLASQVMGQLATRQSFEPVAPPQAAPVQPPAKVFEVTLENARNGDSKCFLDLDTGNVFTLNQSTPDDFVKSTRFLADNGIDIKSDTLFPAEGFAAYELSLIPNGGKFEDLNDYDPIAAQFASKGNPTAIRLEALAASFPQQYLFKTASGAIGVLEILEKIDAPSGMRLRFKIIPKPIVPPSPAALARGGRRGRAGAIDIFAAPATGPATEPALIARAGRRGSPTTSPARAGRGGRANPTPEELARIDASLRRVEPAPAATVMGAPLTQPTAPTRAGRGSTTQTARGRRGGPEYMLQQVATQEERLIDARIQAYDMLRQQYGDNHPTVMRMKAQMEAQQRLLAAPTPEITTDSLLAELNRRKLDLERSRALIDEQMRQLQLSIDAIEKDRRAQAVHGPATMPDRTE